jgi:hypothetical protein
MNNGMPVCTESIYRRIPCRVVGVDIGETDVVRTLKKQREETVTSVSICPAKSAATNPPDTVGVVVVFSVRRLPLPGWGGGKGPVSPPKDMPLVHARYLMIG